MNEEQETWLIEHILDRWDDWEAEAYSDGQAAQNDAAYLDTLRDHLRNAIKRAKAAP